MDHSARLSIKVGLLLVFLGLILIAIVSSCEKTINIQVQPYNGPVSIECMLVSGEVPILYLSRSTAYFSAQTNTQDLFIPDARVVISSSESRDTLATAMARDSFLCQPTYFYRGKLPTRQGLTYSLEVTYQGQVYRAQTTITQTKPTIAKVKYVSVFKDLYGEHEGVVVDFTDTPGQANAYRFEMRRTIDSSARKTETTFKSECNGANPFGVSEVGRAIYFDTGSGDGRPVSVTTEPTYTHHKGSFGVVYLQTMDPASGKFYDQLDRQKLATFNPFVEPVFLTSNIPGCMGVFGHFVRSEPVSFEFPE
ncbi:DUF4249 family protein [Larkinella sp. C7]|uniref:DUF4249 family protein n=1 Tax=Larkinella sp. C7 TaxID=2576607 RepID=UPI001486E3CA|nr:DUF4249 family protein [Larkinella sp. C7]